MTTCAHLADARADRVPEAGLEVFEQVLRPGSLLGWHGVSRPRRHGVWLLPKQRLVGRHYICRRAAQRGRGALPARARDDREYNSIPVYLGTLKYLLQRISLTTPILRSESASYGRYWFSVSTSFLPNIPSGSSRRFRSFLRTVPPSEYMAG